MPKREEKMRDEGMGRVVQGFREGVQKQNEQTLSVATGISRILERIPANVINYAEKFLMVSRLLNRDRLDFNAKAHLKVTYGELARGLGEDNIWPIASSLKLWDKEQHNTLVENKKFIPLTSD